MQSFALVTMELNDEGLTIPNSSYLVAHFSQKAQTGILKHESAFPIVSNYRLTRLEPGSFENLVQALAVRVIGPGVTVFGMGKDGGREATFEGKTSFPFPNNGWDGYGVIQAKFRKRPESPDEGKYSEKDDAWALGELEKELQVFASPGKRRKPDFYVFATNVVLTPVADRGSKDRALQRLQQAVNDGVLRGFTLWDYDQIITFLDAHDGVRRRYNDFIQAGDVLSRLMERLGCDDDYTPSEELEKLASVYVPPMGYEEAKQMLRDTRRVLLSGPPHAGKTAMALHLAHELQSELGLTSIIRLGLTDIGMLQSWYGVLNAVFVLDDCFGVSRLEHQMADDFTSVVGRLTRRNWVIGTTREGVLHEALETTRLGEGGTGATQVVVDATSYDLPALLDILERHLRWMESENVQVHERISPKASDLARQSCWFITRQLVFPHNIERLCSVHLRGVASERELNQAVEKARYIEKAVQQWAEKLDESERWFAFCVALFPAVTRLTSEAIYERCAQILGFRAQDTERLVARLSAYIVRQGDANRPLLRHPSFGEALINLLKERYNNSVGKMADVSLQYVLEREPISLGRCFHADFGWPRPTSDEAPVGALFLTPYLESLSLGYHTLRQGIFGQLQPLLMPCTRGGATVLTIIPPQGHLVWLTLIPGVTVLEGATKTPLLVPDENGYTHEDTANIDSTPGVVTAITEVREDIEARLDELAHEAAQAGVPLRIERLRPQELGRRSPQIHAFTLVREQIKEMFRQHRLYEAWPMTQLRVQRILNQLELKGWGGLENYSIAANWKAPVDRPTLERMWQEFARIQNASPPSRLHPEAWKGIQADTAHLMLSLTRANRLLELDGRVYRGPVFPQPDRVERCAFAPYDETSYSPIGFQKALQCALELFLESYRWMVENNFGPLRQAMPRYRLMPFKVLAAATYHTWHEWPGHCHCTVFLLPVNFPTQGGDIEVHVEENTDRSATKRPPFSALVRERIAAAEAANPFYSFEDDPYCLLTERNFIEKVYHWLEHDLNTALKWEDIGRDRMNFLSELVNSAGYPNAITELTSNVDTHRLTDWPPM